MKQNLTAPSSAWPRALAAFVLGLMLVFDQPVAAQSGEEFRVSAGFGYRANANLDDAGAGDFQETRFNLTASRPVKLNDQWQLDPIVGYGYGAYDFSKSGPWDEIHLLRATVMVRRALNDQWAVFGGPTFALAGESDAEASQTITGGGAAGVTWRASDRLTVGGGLGVTTELEDDARLRPILILSWQFHEQWSLASGYFEAGGGGGSGLEIRYQIHNQWSLSGGAQYQESRFRLSEDGRVRDGVGEDTFVPVYARVTWQATPQASFELLGGVSLGGELRVENRRGQKISEADYDPAAIFGARAVLTF